MTVNVSGLIMIGGKLMEPLLEEIWNDESYLELKAKIMAALRSAADLSTFTDADDILVEHIIDALKNKEYQDNVLDILEDTASGSMVEDLVYGATRFFRRVFNIPDNEES